MQKQFSRGSIILLANGTGIIGYPFAKRNFSSYLIPYTKIYSKRVIELNGKSKNIKLQEENIFVTLNRQRFLKQDMKVFTIKKKDKLVNVKVNNFYLSKDTIKRVKR